MHLSARRLLPSHSGLGVLKAGASLNIERELWHARLSPNSVLRERPKVARQPRARERGADRLVPAPREPRARAAAVEQRRQRGQLAPGELALAPGGRVRGRARRLRAPEPQLLGVREEQQLLVSRGDQVGVPFAQRRGEEHDGAGVRRARDLPKKMVAMYRT